jgi:hypothetical protein
MTGRQQRAEHDDATAGGGRIRSAQRLADELRVGAPSCAIDVINVFMAGYVLFSCWAAGSWLSDVNDRNGKSL